MRRLLKYTSIDRAITDALSAVRRAVQMGVLEWGVVGNVIIFILFLFKIILENFMNLLDILLIFLLIYILF